MDKNSNASSGNIPSKCDIEVVVFQEIYYHLKKKTRQNTATGWLKDGFSRIFGVNRCCLTEFFFSTIIKFEKTISNVLIDRMNTETHVRIRS